MGLEDKAFWIPQGFDISIFGAKTKVLPNDIQVVKLEDVKSFQSNLEKLYEFVCQGSIQSVDETHRAAFGCVKYRMELLFPELVSEK
jgi:hypothetical protein